MDIKPLTHHKSSLVPESIVDKTTVSIDQNINANKNRRKSSISINVSTTEATLVHDAFNAINSLVKESRIVSPEERKQEERRSQLKDKKVLFICCGHDGLDSKKFVFEKAHSLGVKTYLLEDTLNTLAKELEDEKVVQQFIRVDMTPRSNLLNDAMSSLAPVLQQIGGNFDGICTFWDDAVGLCARIGSLLSLHGSSVNSVDIAHDKHLTREAMRKAGLPTPASYLLKSADDLKIAAEIVGAPSILKPMYGASSLGVIKVENIESLEATYNSVVHMLHEFYEEGELMGLTFDEDTGEENGATGFENSSLSWLVLEEFIDGDEVDVDLVLKDGKVLYQCVVDDWPQIQPWFAEMGNSCPSLLPEDTQSKLIAMAIETSIKGMGFQDGVLHCELKNSTTKGPQIIEINPRMGGGPVYLLHKLAFGLDLIEETLYSCLKIKGKPTAPKKAYSSVCCGEKFFEGSMKVPAEFCQLIEAMSRFPNVIEAVPLVKTGEHIIGISDAFPTRCARFTVCGESPIEAKTYAEQLLAMCDIPAVVSAQKCSKK